jgi:hypothetical protein
MAQDKEKIVEVITKEDGQEKKIKIVVKKPNNAIMSQAQRIRAKAWTDCVRDGIMTKKELQKFMENNGIWDDHKDNKQKKILEDISRLEKELYLVGKGGKLKTSEGKNIAVEMRRKRIELREHIGEKMSLEQNTAESLSDNSQFDFLVANCTFYENGQRVYSSIEDYTARSDNELAFAAANNLAQIMYAIDKDFESNLPENKFLKTFNFVNEELSLVNNKGQTVDVEGRRIDQSGYYVNEEGKRIDKDGNLLDENGNYIPSVTYVDEKGKKVSNSDKKAETEEK